MADFSNNINLTLPNTGEFPGTWGPEVNANFVTLDDLFGTGGHSHTGIAGDGPAIEHANLLNSGSKLHSEIDTHIDDGSLHQDTRISLVAASVNNVLGTQVINVTDLRFENSTVEDLGNGVARIIPDAGSATTLDPLTAPVVHFDTFSSTQGRPLGEQCWKVIKPAPLSPEYVTRQTWETPGVGAEMIVATAASETTYVANLLAAPVPHSKIQRTGVVVDKYGPTNGIYTNGDRWSLFLHLLASDRDVNNNVSSPVDGGLSFALTAAFDSGINDIVIRPKIFVSLPSGTEVVFPGAIPAPSNWTNPNGGTNWDNLPLDYFNGQHEFSLSVEDQARVNFVLHYYYNRSLIFKREFTASDGAFYDSVFDLISELNSTTVPTSTADFGHFGFSTSYFTEFAQDMTFAIGCSMSASIGEQLNPRLVALPEGSPDPGTPVCSGDPAWAGVTIPGTFDPDGSGPEPPWNVIGLVAATPNNSEGFIIEQPNSNPPITEIVYCDPPGGGNTTNLPVDQRSNQTNVGSIEGNNLPIGDFSNVNYFVGNNSEIPVDWVNGYNTTEGYYAEGEQLPADFVVARSVERGPGAFGGTLTFDAVWGRRLPWNAIVDVEVDPLYNGEVYTAAYPGAFRVRAGIPDVNQIAVYRYDFLNGAWLAINNNNQITEGDYVFAVVAGDAIPLGPEFWSASNGFDSRYGVDDTTGASADALTVDSGPLEPFEVLYTSITMGRVDVGAGTVVSGVPPQNPVASENDPGVSFAKQATNEEGVVIIGRLSVAAWNGGDPESVVLQMRDTETPQQFADALIIRFTAIRPRPPVIDPSNTGISTLDPDVAAMVTVQVEYPDPDLIVELVEGFTVLGAISRDSATITPGTNSEQWVISGLTTASSGDIVIRVKNQEAFAQYPALGTDEINLGAIASSPGSTPDVTYTSGTLVEDTSSQIVFTTDDLTLEPNSYVEMDSEFFTIAESIRGPDLWTISVASVDLPGGNSFPTPTASATFYNPTAATSTTVNNIPSQEAVAPDIILAELDSIGSGITTWNVGEPLIRAVFLTINNTSPSIIDLSAIQLVNLTGTLDAIIEQREHIAGNVYGIRVRIITQGSVGNSFGVRVGNSTSGEELVDTLDPAITIAEGITIGNLGGAFSTMQEGRYFSFNIPGGFVTDGSNIIVDFRNGGGTSLLHPSDPTPLINTETSTLISGSARLAPDTDGIPVFLYVAYISGGLNTTIQTAEVVQGPPQPVVSGFVINPNTEGTTGSTITVTGNFLAPPASPAGEPALAFVYSFIDDGLSPVLLNTTLTSASDDLLTFSTDIAEGTVGLSVGMVIDYLGGNTVSFPDLATILGSGGGDPAITGLTIGDSGSDAGFGSINTTQIFTVSGSNLSAANVGGVDGASGVQFSVTGFENAGIGDDPESAPGAGTHPSMFRTLYTNVSVSTQSDSEIIGKITFSDIYAGTRLRVHLQRPAGHVLGAGEWPQASIDQITPADPDHLGLTLQGPTTTKVQVNAIPSEGTTRLDTARALQAALAPNSEGTTFTILMRLNQVPAAKPAVLPIADNLYGTYLRSISVATTANPFEFNITATVPTASQTPLYPDGTFNTTNPTVVGLQLSNGIPIASGIVNAVEWDSPGEADNIVPAL